MKKPLAVKLTMMIGIIIFLLIPISQIDGIVDERKSLQKNVIKEIASSSSTEQLLIGPILIQPFVETSTSWQTTPDGNEKTLITTKTEGKLQFLPDSLNAHIELKNELRSRGIYDSKIYHAKTKLTGHFSIPKNFGLSDMAKIELGQPYLLISVSDMRGIKSSVHIDLNGNKLEVKPGSNHTFFSQGIHSFIPTITNQGADLDFTISMNFQGSSRLEFIPIGKENMFQLQSDWPHPSFGGRYLPTERKITTQGFFSTWEMSRFSTNIQSLANKCLNNKLCTDFKATKFGVSFIDPVDVYVKIDRSVKYAILFIILTFVAFFLFELLKDLRIHPVQYALVGLAIAIFYLLLLSLSEHIDFSIAYAISSLSCAALIGSYISSALKSKRRGLAFSFYLTLLYILLYGLISSEDYALLIGSILCFIVLSAVMTLTREVDWYKTSSQMNFNEAPNSNKPSIAPK
ncbi:cell envelope integrity protein CreD [Agaribacterium sp. ZY112]|uniref:cell envelope integrity protein CreD n=1 Tax=Agaribacterium sp. ZY112 TaxID=3233574 RepID=UPI0035254AD7